MNERDFAWYKTVRRNGDVQQQNHIHRLHAKGERQYQRLRSKLEPRYKGHILAIEVESGEYVLGKDELKVALKAVKKFPGKKFSFFRIGYPTVHKLRLHSRKFIALRRQERKEKCLSIFPNLACFVSSRESFFFRLVIQNPTENFRYLWLA